MMAQAPTPETFRAETERIRRDLDEDKMNPHVKRAWSLATAKGGGHDQFLTGIVVNFDLTFSNKAWVEAERYTFLNFISSCSTMHRIAQMEIADCCNAYVTGGNLWEAERLQREYSDIASNPDATQEEKLEAYRRLLYNLPSGFELTAGMTTNYRCLKNIYAQRRTHRLPDWQAFCDWIETLPLSSLITGEQAPAAVSASLPTA